MEITIKIKIVSGKELIYPVCRVSKIFSILCKKSTLDKIDLENIVKLGYKICIDCTDSTERKLADHLKNCIVFWNKKGTQVC